MVACDFAGNDLQFMLHRDLAEKVARDHVTPNLASPEGEGFPPSPMGTLTIGNGASPGSDGNHQPLRWKMTRRPFNANYHQTGKDRPTGGRLRGHKEVPSQAPDDSGRIVGKPDVIQKRASGKWKIFPGQVLVSENRVPIRQASCTLALVSRTRCLPWDTVKTSILSAGHIRIAPSVSRSEFYVTHLFDPARHFRHLIE